MPAAKSYCWVFHRLDRTGSVPKPTAAGAGTVVPPSTALESTSLTR
jgi:hypothetical protein